MNELKDAKLEGRGIPAITGETYATTAENVIQQYKNNDGRGYNQLTTTKLRGIYSLIMNIYTQVNVPEDYVEQKSNIQYLKVRMAYESGRDRSVKSFLEKTHLMAYVDSITDYGQFLLYCRYAEALVAYFKYLGGKD